MRALALIIAMLVTVPAAAQFWSHYVNARFGYELDIPPGYEGQGESENGDGQVFYLPGQQQELTVWGGLLGVTSPSFENEVADRFGKDKGAWTISYHAATPHWASWSGTNDDTVMYQRMILLCGANSYAAFRAVYPASDLAGMHAVIEGLVRSFKPIGC